MYTMEHQNSAVRQQHKIYTPWVDIAASRRDAQTPTSERCPATCRSAPTRTCCTRRVSEGTRRNCTRAISHGITIASY